MSTPGYRMWDERFGAKDYVYGTDPNDFLASVVDRIPPGCVICLGDGEGRNGVFLAEQGFAVTSVDASRVGLQKAEALAATRNVHLDTQVADLAHYDLGRERWEGVVSIFAHLPAEVRRDLHARVVPALKPGGVFILEAYTPSQIGRGTGGPPIAELTMRLHDLRVELAGLDFEHSEELERDVVEGWGHTGPAAVVQVLATKP